MITWRNERRCRRYPTGSPSGVIENPVAGVLDEPYSQLAPLIMRENSFGVDLVYVVSSYAQQAMKSFPRMLSQRMI
jgi:hypothetical protein